MSNRVQQVLFVLRISIGWLFFYAGITEVLNPKWSAAGYLSNAKTLNGFYSWLASDGMIGLTNFVNQWGLTIIGILMILGLYTKWAGYAGAVMMVLYWLPILDFPMAGDHSFLIDDHIIYAIVMILLAFMEAGKYWGFDAKRR